MLSKQWFIVALFSVTSVSFADTTPKTATTPAPIPSNPNTNVNSTPLAVQTETDILQARLANLTNTANAPRPEHDWSQYISFSGLVNVDASYYSKPYFGVGNRQTSASNYLDLGTAELAANAHYGDWLSGRISLLYQNGSSPAVQNADPYIDANRHVKVDEGYITLANFNKTPYFLRAGQQYAPFGRYQLYPLTNTLPQTLSQTNAPIAQLGFVTLNGFYGSLYALSGEHEYNHSNSVSINNGGFTVGFKHMLQQMSFDIGLSYLVNMSDVDSIRPIVENTGGYRQKIPGVGAYLQLFAGPFQFGIQEVAATKRFSTTEYAYTKNTAGELVGAKPSAGDVNAQYSFTAFGGRHNRFLLSYQWSSEAHNDAPGIDPTNPTVLPRQRISAMYGINLVKHLAASVQLYRDYDYKQNHGGTNKQDNVAMLRLSMML